MSTTAQQSSGIENLAGLPQPKIQEMPKLALTGRITKVGDPIVTKEGEGDYDAIELTIEPTNGSRKISFVKIYVRPEFFSFGQLNADDMYVDNPRNTYFTELKEGSTSRTNGQSFLGSYQMNVMPSYQTEKDGSPKINPKTGSYFVRRITGVMAVAGATLEGFGRLVGILKDAVVKNGKPSTSITGLTEITTKEAVDIMNQFIRDNGEPEVAFTAKQSSRNGELTDNYEFDTFEGPWNEETHNRLLKRANDTAGKTGSKKLVIRYSV